MTNLLLFLLLSLLLSIPLLHSQVRHNLAVLGTSWSQGSHELLQLSSPSIYRVARVVEEKILFIVIIYSAQY